MQHGQLLCAFALLYDAAWTVMPLPSSAAGQACQTSTLNPVTTEPVAFSGQYSPCQETQPGSHASLYAWSPHWLAQLIKFTP